MAALDGPPPQPILTHLLQDYGFTPFFAQQTAYDEIEGGRVGRVIEVQRSLLKVFNGDVERPVPLERSWHTLPPEQKPAVGDWVVLDEQLARVDRVLERKSEFRRAAAGDRSEIQLIACNVDVLFVVTSCNEEFSESRLERYLALAAEAGVMPVVVLTKMDECDDPFRFVERVRSVRPDVPVETVNALDEETLGGVRAWIERGSTVALAGSSGVGKSTLLNTLAGADVAATGAIREDDKKGRHTTTSRALRQLPDGGLLIDVPGMRELGVVDAAAGLAAVFDDIEALAANCRFTDCTHQSEPGCAVRRAVEGGEIDERRLANYRKLLRENEHNSASLAEKRSKNRALGKLYKQVQAMKHTRNTD